MMISSDRESNVDDCSNQQPHTAAPKLILAVSCATVKEINKRANTKKVQPRMYYSDKLFKPSTYQGTFKAVSYFN